MKLGKIGLEEWKRTASTWNIDEFGFVAVVE